MSRKIELPNTVYDALEQAAKDSGTTPVGWIKSHLPGMSQSEKSKDVAGPKTRTLADLFAGRVGRIRSGSQETLSEMCADRFTDYLEEKRRGGHL